MKSHELLHIFAFHFIADEIFGNVAEFYKLEFFDLYVS